MVAIPNEMTKDPLAFRALCQALALAVGTSKPEKIWEIEIA